MNEIETCTVNHLKNKIESCLERYCNFLFNQSLTLCLCSSIKHKKNILFVKNVVTDIWMHTNILLCQEFDNLLCWY
jgi:hypothetical protein